MFPCKQCGKSYQSQSSLARHLRNHSIDRSRHMCPTCDVVFSRRDLLMRHMHIHRDGPKTNRRRCHTACQSCRAARVKCNGESPCLTCMLNGRDCCYSSSRSHRVSRMAGPETPSLTTRYDSVSEEGHHPTAAAPEAGASSNPVTLRSPPAAAAEFPMTPIDLPQTGDNPGPLAAAEPLAILDPGGDNLIALSEMDAIDSMSLAWTCSTNVVSWPWLHESLYLQGNPLHEWFPAACGGLVDTNSQSLNFQPLNLHSSDDHTDRNMNGGQSDHVPLSTPISAAMSSALGETPPAPTPLTSKTARDGRSSAMRDPLNPTTRQEDRSAAQARVVEELASYATRPVVESSTSRACYWLSMSLRVSETFAVGDWQAVDATPALFRMLELYRQHFSPLWPLLNGKGFEPGLLHPLLFLTLASIGAMYGDPMECCFGTAMHEEIRKVLTTPLFSLEEVEENHVPLCQARLLTQVAALYFGQRRAFSYAQHLGAITIAQARRMDLFSAYRGVSHAARASSDDHKPAWMRMETRKRLAFGILRADVYTSILLNSRPFLSAEEVDLELPAPDHIWSSPDAPAAQECINRAKSHGSPGQGLSFSDLVRVAFDRSEALLEMDPTHYELLLFGLQEPVWRFSHDSHLFPRLTGSHETPILPRDGLDSYRSSRDLPSRLSGPTHTDQLGMVHRRMRDLRDDRAQLADALQKWEQNFTAVRATNTFQGDRTSIMSSLVLFKLSYLRLTAPLAELHSAAYALSNKSSVDKGKLQVLTLWTQSQEARLAADLSCRIWGLLAHETKRPGPERAKHNLLAFSGLHHAAVVLWVFAGSHEQGESELSLPGSCDGERIPLCRRHSAKLMRRVVDLYRQLTPVGWCSFAAVAERLTLHSFPGTPCETVEPSSYECQ